MGEPVDGLWVDWCLWEELSPREPTTIQLADFVLDLMNLGLPRSAVIAALDHAAEVTGLWRSSMYATLRLGL